MKKIIYICISVLLCITLCGCEKNSFKVGSVSEKEIYTESIVMSPLKYTSTNITIKLQNNSAYSITYGDNYELEIKQDNEWHTINVNPTAEMISSDLNSGDNIEFTIEFYKDYGYLIPGEYRIVKEILINKTDEIREEKYITVEFKLIKE